MCENVPILIILYEGVGDLNTSTFLKLWLVTDFPILPKHTIDIGSYAYNINL